MSKQDKLLEQFQEFGDTTGNPEAPSKPVVDGFECDDVENYGASQIPVYDVSFDEFHQNMNYGRRRLQYKNPHLQKLNLQPMNYIIRTTDANGDTLKKKITR